MSALELALLYPEYAQVYQRAMNRLNEVEKAVDAALDNAIEAATHAEEKLTDTLESAHTLDDGRRVFRDAGGDVWDEHDQRLDEVEADMIEWRGNEPSREDFIVVRRNRDDADAAVHDIRNDQLELGEIREELTDENNPPSKERVEALHNRIGEIHSEYESAPVSTPSEARLSFGIDKPNI